MPIPPFTRREFLQISSAFGLMAGLGAYDYFTGKLARLGIPIDLYLPGMALGHLLKEQTKLPAATRTEKTKIVIIGAGAAGLFAAWRLQQAGIQDFVLVEGAEFGGNAASGTTQIHNTTLHYPRGAHYLPLPTQESYHIRDLLAEMGILIGNKNLAAPEYLETAVVHAPDSRVWFQEKWQTHLPPQIDIPAEELQQQQRFFTYIAYLKQQYGTDGKRLFAIPSALSSQDSAWRTLDHISFSTWLQQQGYTAPSLLWYLDYACKDDYGINANQTSAWAGLHYFASRTGQATQDGALLDGVVLTWADGLNPLIQHMANKLTSPQRLQGIASQIQNLGAEHTIDIWQEKTQSVMQLQAEYVIIATPLQVAAKLIDLKALGFDQQQHMPPHAAWQVSNFVMRQLPFEQGQFAWDTVVYASNSLGFVNANHQLLQQDARGSATVLTAYHAYAGESPQAVRQRLLQQHTDDLFKIAAQDLNAIYGKSWLDYLERVEITLRGHAMASPTVGFLHNQGLVHLRAQNQRILFAHSDLSGFSIFEEATWWGEQAANRIINAEQIGKLSG